MIQGTNRPIYFFSDAHIGRYPKEDPREIRKERNLIQFFQKVMDEKAGLIVNGDLFDFWFEYKKVIPRRCFRLCYELNKLRKADIDVRIVVGNHDYWMRDFFQQEMGVTVYHDPISLTLHGLRTFIAHGDGFAQKDYKYRALKRVIRHPFIIGTARLMHPDAGIWLVEKISTWGDKKFADWISPEEYAQSAHDKLKQGYDLVVFGHTHQPDLVRFHEGIYLNTGNWFHDFSYASLKDGKIEVLYWTDDS
ncbi:MAG: hypothetical protein B6244_02475 [Candidatus Cloacimonetes bacterium 4572_55]|nr:MAG: hypothetical protein B6244_02475 [Candidatus Cloacimonetes bacterium 4572_55]